MDRQGSNPEAGLDGGPSSDKACRLCYAPPSPQLDPWCSGPTCQPVTLEIAGSNPVGSATNAFPYAPSARPDGAFLCPLGLAAGPVATSGNIYR